MENLTTDVSITPPKSLTRNSFFLKLTTLDYFPQSSESLHKGFINRGRPKVHATIFFGEHYTVCNCSLPCKTRTALIPDAPFNSDLQVHPHPLKCGPWSARVGTVQACRNSGDSNDKFTRFSDFLLSKLIKGNLFT